MEGSSDLFFAITHLRLACSVVGKNEKYSPKWWFNSDRFTMEESVKKSPTKRTKSHLTDPNPDFFGHKSFSSIFCFIHFLPSNFKHF